jgi:hypothetical protein
VQTTSPKAHKVISGAITHLGRTPDDHDDGLRAIAILLAARKAVLQ